MPEDRCVIDATKSAGIHEVRTRWYECPLCLERDINKFYVYCPICGAKIEWENLHKL